MRGLYIAMQFVILVSWRKEIMEITITTYACIIDVLICSPTLFIQLVYILILFYLNNLG